jgi:hypothetical protein
VRCSNLKNALIVALSVVVPLCLCLYDASSTSADVPPSAAGSSLPGDRYCSSSESPTYWGNSVGGLELGVAVQDHRGNDVGIRLCLRNVSGSPIRIVKHSFGPAQIVDVASTAGRPRFSVDGYDPGPYVVGAPPEVLELAPGHAIMHRIDVVLESNRTYRLQARDGIELVGQRVLDITSGAVSIDQE